MTSHVHRADPLGQALTLAGSEDEARAEAAGGGSGVDNEALRKQPLALAERDAALKSLRRRRIGVDHVHLSQFDGTDLVQWYGRFSDGWHRPLGRLMKIISVAPDQRPSTEGDQHSQARSKSQTSLPPKARKGDE